MRLRSLTAVAAAAVAALSLTVSAQAGATTAPASAHHGLKPLHATAAAPQLAAARTNNTLSFSSTATTGAVSPTPQVYLVFWGSQWSNDPAGVAPDMQNMFKGLYGTQDTWGTILDQYCEGVAKGATTCGAGSIKINHPTSSPLAGVWFDNAAASPTNATAAQLAAEASTAAGHFGNTTQAPNLNAQYVILSPTGTHPDGFPSSGFCAWHDKTTTTSYGTIAYTNMPYIPDSGAGACTTFTDGRLLSGIESTETHEYAETVTDFWPSIGWTGGKGAEIGDECQNLDAYVALSTGTFDLQGLWSNSANKCVTHG